MNQAFKRAKRQAQAIKTRKNKKRAVKVWCRLMREALHGSH